MSFNSCWRKPIFCLNELAKPYKWDFIYHELLAWYYSMLFSFNLVVEDNPLNFYNNIWTPAELVLRLIIYNFFIILTNTWNLPPPPSWTPFKLWRTSWGAIIYSSKESSVISQWGHPGQLYKYNKDKNLLCSITIGPAPLLKSAQDKNCWSFVKTINAKLKKLKISTSKNKSQSNCNTKPGSKKLRVYFNHEFISNSPTSICWKIKFKEKSFNPYSSKRGSHSNIIMRQNIRNLVIASKFTKLIAQKWHSKIKWSLKYSNNKTDKITVRTFRRKTLQSIT